MLLQLVHQITYTDNVTITRQTQLKVVVLQLTLGIRSRVTGGLQVCPPLQAVAEALLGVRAFITRGLPVRIRCSASQQLVWEHRGQRQ